MIKKMSSFFLQVLVVLVVGVFFLLVLEIMQIDFSPSRGPWEITTCQLPDTLREDLLVVRDGLVGDFLWHSVGFMQVHVPFETGLQSFCDFAIKKLYKYTHSKSITLRHAYFFKCVFSGSPELVLKPPGQNMSVVFINLGNNTAKPLCIRSPPGRAGKPGKITTLTPSMCAITPIKRHEEFRITGQTFLCAYFALSSTLDFY